MKRTRAAQEFLDTFGPHCGAPRPVFTGQFDVAVRAELQRLIEQYGTHAAGCTATMDTPIDQNCLCDFNALRRYVRG